MSSQAVRSTGASEPGGDARTAGHRDGAGDRAGLAAPVTAAAMAAAARALRGAVTGEQAYVLNPGFDDFDLGSPRRQWTYLPELERPGLPLRAMSDPQRKLAHELITAAVSMEGYAKVVSVMAMEHVRRARAVIWHRPPPDFATRLVPRIGEVELPDHVFEPEPDYRITDAERSALAYVRSGPRGIGGADLPGGDWGDDLLAAHYRAEAH
jgi:Protein of unknown function (DUF3500)